MADQTTRAVLIVDDEPDLLELFAKSLQSLLPSIEFYTARSVSEALAKLASRPFDVVVTDLMMPGTDGFELLASMSRGPRRIPVIVISGHLTAANRQRVSLFGGMWCFEKPVPLQELADAVDALLASGPGSVIRGISVAGFLQLLEIEKKTCTLTVRHTGTVGRLFLNRGRLVDAECGDFQGVKAARQLVGFCDAELEVAGVLASAKRTIDQSVDTLLLEAFRLADEARQATGAEQIESAHHHRGLDHAKLSRHLEDLAPLGGFVAAGIYSPQAGLLVRHGDSDALDNELCALLSSSTGGIGGLLRERAWGAVREADITTEDGWLICSRSGAGPGGITLVAVFRQAANLGLLQLRLRETTKSVFGEEDRP